MENHEKNSVSDDIWEEIVNVYVRDEKNLNIREWFEAENPYAFQELTEILLETIRKGYWQPSQETIQELAVEYAKSVARHGEGGGIRGGGNIKLEDFVEQILNAPGDPELAELFDQYKAKSDLAKVNEPLEAQVQLASTERIETLSEAESESAPEISEPEKTEEVQGKRTRSPE
ncbi:MAG: cobaltochelatase subunit CobN [Planctomycetaceae bacterium]